jgi:hypothetical protein
MRAQGWLKQRHIIAGIECHRDLGLPTFRKLWANVSGCSSQAFNQQAPEMMVGVTDNYSRAGCQRYVSAGIYLIVRAARETNNCGSPSPYAST